MPPKSKAKLAADSVDHVDGVAPSPGLTTESSAALVATASAPKTWDGAVMLPIDKLIFTSWNVNEMNDEEFSELVAEIEDGGFDEPADVVPSRDEPGFYLVLGGEHRTRACSSLGKTEMPCVIKTHLIGADEATLKMWSVKRNNLRGRLNRQKYADLEKGLSDKHQIKTEAARNKMFMRGELLKSIQKDDAPPAGTAGAGAGNGTGDGDGGSGDGPDTDGAREKKKEVKNRKKLLEALKTAEQDVLLQSADTVEHGYLYFGQGDNGQKHLVVDETPKLAALVKRAVAACKNESAKIDDLLCAALEGELPKWEAK